MSDEKKKFTIRFASFKGMYDRIHDNLWLMLGTLFVTVCVVALLALVVFGALVKGPEKVMVPDVIGKTLENGLLEMQVKELYPKISLRYSETPGDEGKILDQSPKAGAIVKGYSRVSLVVSRGVVADRVGNYVGQTLDEMRLNLQTLFAGSTRPLIAVGDIVYKPDTSDAGTILEQDPPEGTNITDPVSVNLVVSRGPQYENTRPPVLVGHSINDMLQTITRSKLIFDFTAHSVQEGEIPGTVVAQSIEGLEEDAPVPEFVPNYTHINVDMAMPDSNTDGNVYGIFSQNLNLYPYAVSMRFDAVPEEGDAYTIISFNHTGGSVTIPYIVPSGTTLVLYAGDKVAGRETVR
ncbi:MAG: PASTA domain-containing protein [Treponema sp.]|nr:PASTA domain-containing protein [Treponema sp.]